MLRGPFFLVALALVLVPAALAQAETEPVLVERIDEGTLAADVGQSASATFRLFNLNSEDDFFVSVVVEEPEGWSANVTPNRFFIEPRNSTLVTVAFAHVEHVEPAAQATVRFNVVHGRTGEVSRVEHVVDVASVAAPRVLGAIPNPLPAPLDNAYGTFLLDLAAWIALAVAAILLSDALIRVLTLRAASMVTREMAVKLRRPVFLFVLLYGFGQSLTVLPKNAALDYLSRVFVAIAIGAFGLFVVYKGLEAALFYYQQEISPRTRTKIDDVVVPVIRKVGIVVLYVVGIVYALRLLGWDPTIIFAGAGIAGLVIAFAAQDTFSNLFSGLFLMLDRPFQEGDIILLETGEVARVENIGLRTTRLYQFEYHHVITVPNNQLATRRIVNYSAPDLHFRTDIPVGVAYGSDTKHVERVLLDVARAHPDVVKDEPWAPVVRFRDFAESSMNFVLRVTVSDPRDRNRIPSNLRHAIKEAFDREGIEIPFPQRVVHVKGAASPLEPEA